MVINNNSSTAGFGIRFLLHGLKVVGELTANSKYCPKQTAGRNPWQHGFVSNLTNSDNFNETQKKSNAFMKNITFSTQTHANWQQTIQIIKNGPQLARKCPAIVPQVSRTSPKSQKPQFFQNLIISMRICPFEHKMTDFCRQNCKQHCSDTTRPFFFSKASN